MRTARHDRRDFDAGRSRPPLATWIRVTAGHAWAQLAPACDKYPYRSGWNEDMILTERPFTVADLLNSFSEAGLRYPGIMIFKLRPCLDRRTGHSDSATVY